jgi:membrane-associated phospholipid phosphatase
MSAKFLLFFVSLIFISVAEAEETRLRFLDVFTKIPETSVYTLKTSFSKEAIPGWAAIVGSTAVLYHYDEKLFRGSEQIGRDLGIGNKDNTKPVVTSNGQDLLRLPSDTGSMLYFLGDGWMHLTIAGSIMGYGYAKDRTYEVNTGLILVHGIVVSTIFNQTLKRSFGRESPNVKTQERGAWRPFPSFNEYNAKTAEHDAMPSGHVMTATLTFTILAERYPDQKIPIYSVGGVWIGALMFQMMNNGVHWASDYPLGIAMGYVIGKASTRMVQGSHLKPEEKEVSWNLVPLSPYGGMGMMAFKSF